MFEKIVLEDRRQTIHQKETTHVTQDYVLEVCQSAFRKIVVKLDWLFVAPKEQTLVHPVCDKEEKCCHWVHNWQST